MSSVWILGLENVGLFLICFLISLAIFFCIIVEEISFAAFFMLSDPHLLPDSSFNRMLIRSRKTVGKYTVSQKGHILYSDPIYKNGSS